MNHNKIRVKKLENSPYVIVPDQVIGKGSFSTIVRAYNTTNPSEELVSKIISVKDVQTSQTIKTELQVLKALPHHINLVNCMKFQISSQNNFYLIMQYCNQGNLQKYMSKNQFQISQDKIWYFLKQFCDGYKILYDNKIVHRDIKPENILIHNSSFKIADFGLSKNVEDTQIITNMSSKGTPLYMAPEIHQQKQGNSKVDVFSLGVVLYRLAFGGQFPFFDQGRRYRSINEYFKQLLIRKLAIPQTHKRSRALTVLIQQMLIKDKDKRISWQQIFGIEQIKNAVCPFTKTKQLHSFDQLRRSLMIINNKSITEVKIIQQSSNSTSTTSLSSQKQQPNIVLENTFNKENKTEFQKVLFRNKLLYTLVQYTNRKIELANQKIASSIAQDQKDFKKYQQIYKHIIKKLRKLIEDGILFSLYVISRLQKVSGDWSKLESGQIFNFQQIFANDKGIFLDQYNDALDRKRLTGSSVCLQPKYIIGSYQDNLYSVLSEYFEYPVQVRCELRSIYALLVDVYDLGVKYESALSSSSQKLVEYDQCPQEFYQYLIDVETVDEKLLKDKMQKKGLVFL